MEEETLQMTAQEAIKYVSDNFNVPSKYALAKLLSDEKLKVQPIQITGYIEGRKMRRKTADRFFETFGIIITDVYEKRDWAASKG